MRSLACLLSLLAPGSGQFLLGHRRRGVVWLVLCLLASPLFAALLPGATRAGLFWVDAPLLALAFLLRPLCAIDAATLKEEERPGGLVIAGFFVGALALFVGASLFTRVVLVESFKIPAGSMTPTIALGDRVFVDKQATALERGHPIVFRFPEHRDEDFIKRVIATGGDRLEMRAGHPWINGWEVPHCDAGPITFQLGYDQPTKRGHVFVEFLGDAAYLTMVEDGEHAIEGPWTVPPGQAMVLGDNRDNSYDSRKWNNGLGGAIRADDVRGEPFFVWLGPRGSHRVSEPKPDPTVVAGVDKCMKARPARAQCNPPSP